ncbi:MAG: hypothetical protein Q9216_002710 [Gyalolechia sp. 2 TL-2023]
MAPEARTLTTRVTSGSPYQLDQSQTLKASSALLKHISDESDRKEAASTTKNLLKSSGSSDENDSIDAEPIWLILTTKKLIADQRRLKPGKIHLPHPLNTSATTSICLITCDPQRQFKDTIAHPSFPTSLSSRITKIIGISKLKARYQPFENKRQLLNEHDVFLADARVITMLPKVLGKTFYKSNKKPIPVSLEPHRQTDASGKRVKPSSSTEGSKTIAPPQQIAKEIEKTLSCALVHLSPSNNVTVRIGFSSFTSQQVADNVKAVVTGLIEKFVAKGWRNVRGVHIKGPNTMALPIWLADELWVEDEDVLENEDARELRTREKQRGMKRKERGLDKVAEREDPESLKSAMNIEDVEEKGKKRRKVKDTGLSEEMRKRREKLREQKRLDREEMQEKTRQKKTVEGV